MGFQSRKEMRTVGFAMMQCERSRIWMPKTLRQTFLCIIDWDYGLDGAGTRKLAKSLENSWGEIHKQD